MGLVVVGRGGEGVPDRAGCGFSFPQTCPSQHIRLTQVNQSEVLSRTRSIAPAADLAQWLSLSCDQRGRQQSGI